MNVALAPIPTPYAESKVGPNRVALLKDGFQAFPAMLAAITAAKNTICFETYILKDDELGLRFLKALIERAQAGVEVLLTLHVNFPPLTSCSQAPKSGAHDLELLNDALEQVVEGRLPTLMEARQQFLGFDALLCRRPESEFNESKSPHRPGLAAETWRPLRLATSCCRPRCTGLHGCG